MKAKPRQNHLEWHQYCVETPAAQHQILLRLHLRAFVEVLKRQIRIRETNQYHDINVPE